MHEIERFCFERIGNDGVFTNLETRKIEREPLRYWTAIPI